MCSRLFRKDLKPSKPRFFSNCKLETKRLEGKMMDGTVIQDLRERLVKVGREIQAHGFVPGTVGNTSARIPNTDTILIKPSGVSMGALKPEDLAIVDLQGKQIQGELSLSIETPMHTAIYRTRDDVRGVVHSHAPTATAFGVAGIEILPILIEMFLFIPNGVPIVPFEFPGTQELAEVVGKKIKDFDAVILENHGIVTVGPSIEDACNLNIMVEECAKTQFIATLLAGPDAITMEKIREKFKL
ncbi:MAG: class II aldolase/adducin family protein [Candidatus Bathyarchaeota archaeon]|nr:class II aldolase/adducin family protein [Candidatus Bathyarchaeota archaeon]